MLRLQDRLCSTCGEPLPPDYPNRRFCSQACFRASPEFGRKRCDPTPEEIEHRAAQVRRTWTARERANRLTVPFEPWTAPVVANLAPALKQLEE